ncbi:MAG: DUF3782 domain-containing protein [Desulfovibrionales bacterium]|nr:MAG: DUF3782 domain-containing protein [Desulfovibrionales bacterium]
MPKNGSSDFFRDVKELFAETTRQFQETDRKFQETDKKFQDTDKKFQDTDKKFGELRRLISQLGSRLGDFVEEMVRPAAVRLFHERGVDVRQIFQNVTRYDDQGRFVMEIDLLAVDTNTAVAIECKSHCSVEDVKEHIERLHKFKDCFPQYAGFQLYGAMAAMVMPDDVARFAYRQGLYVLAQSGNTIQIRNDSAFHPKQW